MQKLFNVCIMFLGLSSLAQYKTEVILVGTYHMAGTSDKVKVNTSRDDILGEKRQKELDELLSILAAYSAEKIYVENEPVRQMYWDSIYAVYNEGKEVKLRNEIFQIGVKLAARLHLKRAVTCVDWHLESGQSESDRLYAAYCKNMQSLSDSIMHFEPEFSVYDKIVMDEIEAFNYEIPNLHLVSVFKQMNSREHLKKLYYGNITTYLDENAQGMGTFWTQYQMMRNYTIYSNIIKDVLKNQPKRVLVLYGAGHIEALRTLFESHPGIEVIDFSTLYKENEKSGKRI